MKKVNFTHFHVENFGKFQAPIEHELGHRVIISGANGLGKSTLKRAIQYILGTKDENGKEISGIRPHDENGVDIDGLTTVAELTVSVDGMENTLKRTCFQEKSRQGEYTGKDNLQYFVDDVKKGTKKAYEEFVSGFLPNMVCISAQEFLSKDTAGRRAMLEVFGEHDTDSIINENSDFEPLRAKLKANTVTDLKKACRDKIKTQTKERDAYPARIDELEKQKVDIDVAELELLKNSLNEKIAENKGKQANVDKQFEEYDKLADGIIELKCELSDLERKANEELEKKRGDIGSQQWDYQKELGFAEQRIKRNKQNIEILEETIKKNSNLINICREDWKQANERVFNENSLVCSYCGQEYPKDKKERLRADFESHKAEELETVTKRGNELKSLIDKVKADIEKLRADVEKDEKLKTELGIKISELETQYNELHQSIDISDREDVKAIKVQIDEKEQAMNKANSGVEIRQQLQSECEDLQSQLAEINSKLALAQRNVEIDERISDLRSQQRKLSQDIADIEKELSLLVSFERKKAHLLEEDVNKNFSIVKFKMFREMQNGELADICSPFVNGTSYDGNLNFSSKILAEIDVCLGFQRHFDIQMPIIIDNAESINDFRLPNIENQMVIFRCSDEPELTIKNLD